jgi:hypothetical protein
MTQLDDVVCTHCQKTFRSMSRKTFLGFHKYACTACESTVIYPLGTATRVVYWVVVALFLIFAVVGLLNGEVPVPGLLLIGGGYALVRDASIRRQLKELPQPKWR